MRAGRSALRADRCGTGQRVAWRPGRQHASPANYARTCINPSTVAG